ncbi:hypothetical protein SK128_003985 [Halocaridina rubra]|uniref:Uncharacterized protein n=1 Tax=Halocaridina rubra TaxID=373956 RepID=A0AAN8ZVP2_HALRR
MSIFLLASTVVTRWLRIHEELLWLDITVGGRGLPWLTNTHCNEMDIKFIIIIIIIPALRRVQLWVNTHGLLTSTLR